MNIEKLIERSKELIKTHNPTEFNDEEKTYIRLGFLRDHAHQCWLIVFPVVR